MPIRFRCQDCRSRVKVPEGSQGKQVKCPRCGRIQSVPNRNHDSGLVGASRGDLTVHTHVGSIHKTPKRKESLVGPAGDRFDAFDCAGGGVPGGLDIPSEAGNGYHGKDPMSRKQRRRQEARARAAQEAEVAESRKRVEDLFATSHDDYSSQIDGAVKDTQRDTEVVTKAVPQPEAIALDGGGLLTDEGPGVVEPVLRPGILSEQPVEETVSVSLSEQSSPAHGVEPESQRRWTLDLTAEAYPFLKLVPWVMRVAALMLIGPAFKAMLVANEQGFSGVVCLLVLFAGLTLVAVTWTVGEIATAIRDIALRKATG